MKHGSICQTSVYGTVDKIKWAEESIKNNIDILGYMYLDLRVLVKKDMENYKKYEDAMICIKDAIEKSKCVKYSLSCAVYDLEGMLK